MLNTADILETINMIRQECLDIRTITMGISLYDCVSEDEKRLCDKIYDKIMYSAKDLVSVGCEIEKKYGIPIVNKRVSVTPISLVGGNISSDGYVNVAKTLQRAATDLGINFIGGYSALVHKGETVGASRLIESIPYALSETDIVCSSVNVASTKTGINMDALKKMGDIIKHTAYLTKDKNSIGCAKLVVFANVPEDNPFMAGAFHGVGEPETVINVGVSGPGVVASAIKRAGNCDLSALADIIKKTAFKITRVGQLVAGEAAERLGVPFGIVDLSLAPTPAIGDSVAHVLENMGLECCGAHGTTAALAMLNDAVKKGGVMASSHVGGLSGAFIPVSEDAGMISAVERGVLSIEKLEAMTAVCSVGLDMIAIPGDTDAAVICGIIADEISIGVANTKTTAVRVIPAYGKNVGDSVDFGGLLGTAPIMSVRNESPAVFINRGGRVPAPIHSLKN
ncbi:MAG: PFL family protein [Ruminococcaceae bacterium]|nr:PFL family protein [Oscillospiraceae bacterium]MBO4971187.1 PFL family protein [Clostridia bacterium]MBQ1259893.1 PFL family protein [Clostridia bacterium]